MLSGGHAVVADFGIARAIDASRSSDAALTGTGMAIGTPAYMSPEQATADAVDARSDQYSLACVFYEMVTGSQPFTAATMQALLTKVLTGPRPRLSSVVHEVPPEVDAAVLRALQQEPAKRFPTIMDFADALTSESTGAAAATRESRRWKRLAVVLPVVVAAAAAVWVIFIAAPSTNIVSGAETIAIVPFTTSGAAVEGLGEGMVDLLGGSLDGVGEIRTIPSRQVMREWQRRAAKGQPGLDGAIAVARSVKAASVLTGSVVASGNSARLTAELFDLAGKQLARAQVDGPADSILNLADQLAVGVLRNIWKSREPLPSANSSGITSASMPAIRAYLDGEGFHRRGEWDSAQVAFERAVVADSTFALAWYKLANTMGWLGAYNNPRAGIASANAVRYSAALPEKVRSLLAAYQMFQRGDVAAADSMRAYTERNPQDADGWYLLGESQYHTKHMIPRARAELIAPFDRVLEIDSSLTPAAIHPFEMALLAGDAVAQQRYMTVFERAGAADALRRARAGRLVVEGVDSAVRNMISRYGPTGVVMAAIARRMMAPDATAATLGVMLDSLSTGIPGPQRPFALAPLAALYDGLGQVKTAKAIADTVAQINPAMREAAAMLPIYAGLLSPTQRQKFATGLARAPANNAFVAFMRALMAVDMGDGATAAAEVAKAQAMPDSTRPPFLNGPLAILGGLAIVAQGDTVRGLTRAEAGLRVPSRIGATPFSNAVSLRLAMIQVARPATRDAGIRRLEDGFSDQVAFIPITQLYLGRAHEAAGHRAEATAAYGQFLRLWERADTMYSAHLAEARDALVRLTAEGAR